MKLQLFISKCMFWMTIPVVAGLEYWEHFLTISNQSHLFIQAAVLVSTCLWVIYWDRHIFRLNLQRALEKENRFSSRQGKEKISK